MVFLRSRRPTYGAVGRAGESLHEIGRAFGKDHGSIQFLLSQHGGIVPTVRRRSPLTLTLAEREEISRGLASGASIREIARGLDRAASTVSREVARHGGRPVYRASEADHQAWKSALRPKTCLLATHVRTAEPRIAITSSSVNSGGTAPMSGTIPPQIHSLAPDPTETCSLSIRHRNQSLLSPMRSRTQ